MKKMFIVAMVLVLILCACGKKNNAEGIETAPPNEVTTEATEAAVETTILEVTEAPTEAGTESVTAPVTEPSTEAPTEPRGEMGVVTARSLNVREEPSINSSQVAKLPQGTEVEVFEQIHDNGMTWGQIDNGWICMDYIRMGEPASEYAQSASANSINDNSVLSPENEEARPQNNGFTEDHNHSENSIIPPEHKNEGNELQQTDEQNESDTQLPHFQPSQESIPEQTSPTPQKPAEKPVPTQPTPCQHQWNVTGNTPAEYEYHNYVVCSCGARFSDAASWRAHSDSYSGDELLNHTGYASGSDKTEVAPPMTSWACANCGISKTISSWDNP